MSQKVAYSLVLHGGSLWISMNLTDISRGRFKAGKEQDDEEEES